MKINLQYVSNHIVLVTVEPTRYSLVEYHFNNLLSGPKSQTLVKTARNTDHNARAALLYVSL